MQNKAHEISGNLIDVIKREIYPATIRIEESRIHSIQRETIKYDQYILPGLLDAHVHIESSMLIPSEFAREAVKHGTVGTISDPHEIANVLGIPGIRFMIENGKKVPFYFYFGAPSCVPATPFESSGSIINAKDIDELLSWDDIYYLAEMMNFPGVIHKNEEVLSKIHSAAKRNKKVDGHAPGLKDKDAISYFNSGITTDHECFTLEEALEKANLGVNILIREGSAARNFDTLIPLLQSYPHKVMFCSDDKHPDELIQGHINKLVARAIHKGYDVFDAIRACTYNPVKHYNLNTGLLQIGDFADFIVVDDLNTMDVKQTWIQGIQVFHDGVVTVAPVNETIVNAFNARKVHEDDIKVKGVSGKYRVIAAIEHEIVTEELHIDLQAKGGYITTDTERDILKIVVVNRYQPAVPSVGFIHNFGLKTGAIASTVAHDSHNIIAVGVDDDSLCKVINHLIDIKGGICVADRNNLQSLALPVAGLMSLSPAAEVAVEYRNLDERVKANGCRLTAPFMTLSFMTLLVIPKLKLSDQGLFDGNQFSYVSLLAD